MLRKHIKRSRCYARWKPLHIDRVKNKKYQQTGHGNSISVNNHTVGTETHSDILHNAGVTTHNACLEQNSLRISEHRLSGESREARTRSHGAFSKTLQYRGKSLLGGPDYIRNLVSKKRERFRSAHRVESLCIRRGHISLSRVQRIIHPIVLYFQSDLRHPTKISGRRVRSKRDCMERNRPPNSVRVISRRGEWPYNGVNKPSDRGTATKFVHHVIAYSVLAVRQENHNRRPEIRSVGVS